MAKEEPQAEEEQASGGKKKMIIIIVGALLLVGIAVGATLFLIGGGDEQASAEAVPEEPAKPERGDPTYVELKTFTVNLGPEDPVGFLQVQVSVLTYFSEVADELDKNKPLIRNNLTMLFGQQNSQDLRSPEGKRKLQEEVKNNIQQVINKYGSGGEIENVFFTTFVMQ